MSLSSIAGSLASFFGRNYDTLRSVGSLVNPWNDQGIIGGVLSGKPVSDRDSGVLQAAKNWAYNFTGQTEKTSAYQAQMAREDSAYQRLSEDMQKAGLSKFNIGSGSPQTGSYGNGSVQALSMLGALADMKKVFAESRKTEAEAISQEQKNDTYSETHAAELALTLSQADYNSARTELTRLTTPAEAEKIIAETEQLVADTALAWSKNAISQIDLNYAAKEHVADLNYKNSATNVNIHKRDEVIQSIEVMKQQIVESVARANNLNEQSKKVVEDTVVQTLMASIIAYDYDYSISSGKRYKDNQSSLLGIDVSQIGTLISRLGNGLVSGAKELWNKLFE